MKYPHEVQEELFKKIITTARNTEYGRTHGFADVHTPEQFRRLIYQNCRLKEKLNEKLGKKASKGSKGVGKRAGKFSIWDPRVPSEMRSFK